MSRGMVIYINNVYILFSVGRLCCSFRLSGQCESLYTVERVTGKRLHVFFICLNKNLMNTKTLWNWSKPHKREVVYDTTFGVFQFT